MENFHRLVSQVLNWGSYSVAICAVVPQADRTRDVLETFLGNHLFLTGYALCLAVLKPASNYAYFLISPKGPAISNKSPNPWLQWKKLMWENGSAT